MFQSAWPLRQIGRELVLGIGYVILQTSDIPKLIEGLEQGRVRTRLRSMREDLAVEIENPRATLDGRPIGDKVRYYLGALSMYADGLMAGSAKLSTLEPFVAEVLPVIATAVERSTLELNYNIRYKHVYVLKRTLLRKGHLRKEVSLLCPVGQVNGLNFVVDAQERCGKTCITSSLWLDVCIGRREGPIVRRVAEREIGCREDATLYKLERLVYDVIHRTRPPEDLRRVVPELLRRDEAQQIG